MALTVWGMDAGGGPYAAITALTNIPATILAAVFYEAVFADYSRSATLTSCIQGILGLTSCAAVTPANADFLAARLAHEQHGQGLPTADRNASASTEKVVEGTLERV